MFIGALTGGEIADGDLLVIRTDRPSSQAEVETVLRGVYELYLDAASSIPHIVQRLASVGIQATVEPADLVWLCDL